MSLRALSINSACVSNVDERTIEGGDGGDGGRGGGEGVVRRGGDRGESRGGGGGEGGGGLEVG